MIFRCRYEILMFHAVLTYVVLVINDSLINDNDKVLPSSYFLDWSINY